ncbi:MAG: hypothetical protein U9N00_00720, partial [Candidatus Bipolaricaulota bacterium]|nr:hypothetical protein [Candidatus Bipolaricaulota bacterium]
NNSSTELTTIMPSIGGGGFIACDLPFEITRSVAERIWFQTDIAMYAATEFMLLEELDQMPTNLPDTLLPTWARTVKEEAGAYALDNILQANAASEVGLELALGPRLLQEADTTGKSPYVVLEENLNRFAQWAGLSPQDRPKNERWIFAEYAGGDPRFVERDDDLWPGGTWETYEQRLTPGALGMGLLAQASAAETLIRSEQALDRYIAYVLTEAMTNKLVLLDEMLAREVDPSAPRYYAHEYSIEFDGNGTPIYQVTQDESQLLDDISLLWGLSEFIEYASTQTSDMFAAAGRLDPRFHALAVRLREEVFQHMLERHRDTGGTFLSSYIPGQEVDNQASSQDLGLLIVALLRVNQTATDELSAQAHQLLLKQADILLSRQMPDGAVAPVLGSSTETLSAYSSVMRGLLAAYEISGHAPYLVAATLAFDYLEKVFWDERLGVYASWAAGTEKGYCYTPFDVGVTVGALRELAQYSDLGQETRYILDRLSRFFRTIVDEAALQLSHSMPAGTYGTYVGSGIDQIMPLQVAESRLGVAPVLQQQICLEVTETAEPCCGIESKPEPWFQTDISMYASYELQAHTPENEDYADSNLASLFLHSTMGTPFDAQLSRLATLAGLSSVPQVEPTVLEYESGSPLLDVQGQLAWNEETFFDRITGSTVGMTLLRQAQEMKQLLSVREKNEAGFTAGDNFYALLLGEAIAHKVAHLKALSQEMLQQVGKAYIPHAVREVVANNEESTYEILDSSVMLFDQLALIWGLSEAYGLIFDEAYSGFVAANLELSSVAQDDILHLVTLILATMHDLLYNSTERTLVDGAILTDSGWEKEPAITTMNVGLAMVALQTVVEKFGDSSNLVDQARSMIDDEIRFLVEELQDGSRYVERGTWNGAGPGSLDLHFGPLTTQLAALRGLLAAYQVTGNVKLLAMARETYDVVQPLFLWLTGGASCDGLAAYPASTFVEDGQAFCVTPLDVGLAAGALDELALLSDPVVAREIRDTFAAFFLGVVRDAHLQLSTEQFIRGLYGAEGETLLHYAPVFTRSTCLFSSRIGKPIRLSVSSNFCNTRYFLLSAFGRTTDHFPWRAVVIIIET